jgi:RHH-type proline utilization regulon transcriptional repressor/proline dehydrogenase/delta 1-pyrroline-5-carboxylate dehydrogenase
MITDLKKPTDLVDIPEKAVELASQILKSSREKETTEERNRSAMMARMMDDSDGKKFTIAMADQVLRIKDPERAALRMDRLVDEFGVPKYFSGFDRWSLKLGNGLANWFPRLVIPKVKSKVREDSEHVIISAEPNEFEKYLQQRKQSGVRINFNQLGEAVLGDHEADRRLRDNIQRLIEPGVNYISVKLSSIVSQISLTGYQQTIEFIKPRLREIYRAAIKGGGGQPKFVNLDMEEYRDLHLTVDVFRAVLDEAEFDKFEAGIVLQAYLPDSFEVLQGLTDWSRQRKNRTGSGIKIRLVKGANLAMEQVEASLRDWPQAPYYSKLEVDANYKRMLEFACRPENADVVRIGVGSHNLFDIAFAMLLRERRSVQDRVEFEMLEGMANAQAVEILERTGDCLVYSPVVLDAEFEAAIAYLVRRLDENTSPGSFLGALFALQEGTPAWQEQRDRFLEACRLAFDPSLPATPNRLQNRLNEETRVLETGFHNSADTDFSIPANRVWAQRIIEDWKDRSVEPIPLVIAGESRSENLTGEGHDPSRPGYQAYRFAQANVQEIENALDTAVKAGPQWNERGVAQRAAILRQAAVVFAQQRGETIGAMLLDAGKNITEADVEVSEAIDFANYYAEGLDDPGWSDGTQFSASGVVVITPPWNFPYAIPAGGTLAALAAGNAVILKPARESVLVAWKLACQLWEAGVPREVLQFAPTVDGETGKALVSDSRVAAVILTGSIFTAQLFQSWRPDLKLYAETSGKNALIITAAADLDLAIKDLVRGAFGHAGQKCSATSLALVEKSVYDDPKFMQQLKDAASSLKVAGSWDPSAVVTPVIRQPDKYLMQGLTQLDAGETWLIEPEMVDNNPCLWRPGIRVGVRPGSWYHKTECFGPVLGLIRVENLEEAIRIQNSSEFGLTGGLHSLDPAEIELWREKVEVGNAYINRTTTGAIVRRQPFGGWKDSCVGPGPKAGGPNYVATFCEFETTGPPTLVAAPSADVRASVDLYANKMPDEDARETLKAAAGSYAHWWQKEFSKEHDPSQIHGETNVFRYRHRPWHLLRIQDVYDPGNRLSIAMVAIACQTTGAKLRMSLAANSDAIELLATIAGAECVVEGIDTLANRLADEKGGTIRILGEYAPQDLAPAKIGNLPIVRSQVYANGRIELLNYLKEQSMTETVHRYGNII